MISWKRFARRLLCGLFSGIGVVSKTGRGSQKQATILIYHSVIPRSSEFTRGLGVSMSPKTFERQMIYLSQHYTILALRDLVQALEQRVVPENAIVITFDDGFYDNYEFAWPILQCYSIPATIFISPEAADGDRVLWPNRLTFLRNRWGQKRMFALLLERWSELAASASAADSWPEIVDKLAGTVPLKEMESFLEEIYNWAEVLESLATHPLYLGWTQIKEMQAGGAIEFGNHTLRHANLALLDYEEQQEQIIGARDSIKYHLGVDAPLPFAYPFGHPRHFCEYTPRLVRDSGHNCAVLGIPNPITAESSPFELGRFYIPEGSLAEFTCRLNNVTVRNLLTVFPGGRHGSG